MYYWDFKEAREFVRGIGLDKIAEWKKFCKSGKKPDSIPHCPETVYINSGWLGYGDWLGTGRIATFNKKYRRYEEARKFVIKLGLKRFNEWQEFCKSGKKPDDVPSRPERTYKDKGWKSWKEWLGSTSYSYDRYHLRFKDAREYARSTGIKRVQEWYDFCKSGSKNPHVPSNPSKVYRSDGWKGMKDWLGVK